jgi:hypothetical protein
LRLFCQNLFLSVPLNINILPEISQTVASRATMAGIANAIAPARWNDGWKIWRTTADSGAAKQGALPAIRLATWQSNRMPDTLVHRSIAP